MTIRQHVIEWELGAYTKRLEKLIEFGAPQVVIEAQRALISDLEAGTLVMRDKEGLLDLVAEITAVRTGRGGKVYLEFDNGVRYFPTAKYGRFITR